jgi:hypothetical protein
MHIDFTPLIPVVNGFIVALAGLLTAMVPVLVAYLGIWLRNHGIAAQQAALQIVSDRVTATIQNGLKYATTAADDGITKLNVRVDDPLVAKAANYAILQSPDLLKKAGIDVTTAEGQQALVRRVTAASAPAPAVLTPQLDVHVDTDTSKKP